MLHESKYYCPECDNGLDVPEPQMSRPTWSRATRREFMGTVGVSAAALIAAPAALRVCADDAPLNKQPMKPAEGLVRELYESLSTEQKRQLVFPWDHKRDDGVASRLGTYNSAILGKRLDQHLSKAQRELVERTVKSILSDDEAWERITRYGNWDSSGSFEHCGCAIFGEPSDDKKFSWVFSGHHLTLRCDGNSEPGTAFGGPVFYGHSAAGYSDRNVYYYQTKQVQSVFDSLDTEQRKVAVAPGNPGDRERGMRLQEAGKPLPGIGYEALSAEQRTLVQGVMRTLLEPFRQEDATEVMDIAKANGGMEKIHLAFYQDRPGKDEPARWDYWRLEGPGFVWNYRVLPHVHCYVNITRANV